MSEGLFQTSYEIRDTEIKKTGNYSPVYEKEICFYILHILL